MKIIECPRDAMQGVAPFIPTAKKTAYIQELLHVGFDTIDVGSFVSPKVIPQMRDTWKVLSRLDMSETDTKLLTIVANMRGATQAADYEQVSDLGFPFSISPTFQERNTNTDQNRAFELIQEIHNLCLKKNKRLVVYLSMCFGNPYGDVWDMAFVEHWIDRFFGIGIELISLSDTVGVATPKQIELVVRSAISHYPKMEFGVHLHTHAHNWKEKVEAAYKNGCRRFDGAIKGYGGCPMAQDSLVGNMPTEHLLQFFANERGDFFYNEEAFANAMRYANEIFTPVNDKHTLALFE